MKEILSTKNEQIKKIKKLHKKKYREEYQLYLLEGFHLVEEAVKAEAEIEQILISNKVIGDYSEFLHNIAEDKVILVSDEVFKHISELPAPQGIMSVVKMPKNHQLDNFTGKWLLLDNVQDPGNVGTMVRTADAAGFDGVILGTGSGDVYNSKVLRAMQGSHFHLSVYSCELEEIIDGFQQNAVPVYGTELNPQAVSYRELEKSPQVCLIMGNEGQGVAKKILEKTDRNVYIPIFGKAESLNVAVAAGILMYHFS